MTLRKFFDEASGPYLAVIDGRFLPLDDLSVNIQQETEPVYTASSTTSVGTVATSQQLELSFKTRRDPMMRNAHEVTQRVFLYNRSYKMTLENLQSVQYGMDAGGIEAGFETGWELQFVALDWDVEPR